MSGKERVPTDGSQSFVQKPFAALSSEGLPAGADTQPETPGHKPASARSTKPKDRGRVDILRSTAHRGGKTVTVVKNFVGIGLPEKEKLAKQMQKSCGTGGTVKEGQIEIQGDKRQEVARILTEAGFRPVFAGG
jgi:translation initiation factor 1